MTSTPLFVIIEMRISTIRDHRVPALFSEIHTHPQHLPIGSIADLIRAERVLQTEQLPFLVHTFYQFRFQWSRQFRMP